MTNQDVRWQQRLHNFQKALAQLDETVALMQQRSLFRLEKQGVIHIFGFTYEMGSSTLEDFLAWQA